MKKKRRWLKRMLIVLSILLLLVIVGGGWLLTDYALNQSQPFSMCASIAKGLGQPDPWLQGKTTDRWLENDRLRLHAWWIENPEADGKIAIVCHGYACSGTTHIAFIRHWYEKGYSVLMPDARAHGQSDGQLIGMGWPERLDICKWINTLVAEDPDARILLHGISMGGATVMMVSGEKLPGNVKAIIEDCGYSSAWDEFAHQMKAIFKLPAFPLLHVASGICKLRAGYFFSEASAIEQIKKSVTPTLFIHGTEDTFVPYVFFDRIYEAAACEKERLDVVGAVHGASSSKDPVLYWNTADAFVDRYIVPQTNDQIAESSNN